jgi:signal transduction histidine kinase
MKRDSLEPGLLSVFRLFIGVQFVVYSVEVTPRLVRLTLCLPPSRYSHTFLQENAIWLLHTAFGMPYEPQGPNVSLYFNAAVVSLLAIYLWWPRLQRSLGRFFLPLGLLIAAVGPLIGEYLDLVAVYRSTALDDHVLVEAWQPLLVLSIALVLIAWQYDWRAVALFCVGTGMVDVSSKLLALGPSGPYMFLVLAIISVRTVCFGVVGYMIVRLATVQRQQRRALAQANAQLTHYATTLEQLATSRERNRLARELHDTLAHTLSGMAVELEGVKSLWDTDPAQARAMLDQSLTVTRSGLTEMRRALQALRAVPLEDLGLVLAVRTLAESVAAQTGATLTWQGSDTARLERLAPDVEQCVYRVAQEALENVARHAGARHLTVQLARDKDHLILQISDDGCGFDLSKASANGHHFGLKGMRERIEMIGGALQVESRPGSGTTIRMSVEDT